MIIECSRCHTRAKLPDSKEGAKVRCPDCGHVYVAQSGGARAATGRKKEDPTKYFIIGGAILVFAIFAIIASKGDKHQPPVEASETVVDTGPIIPTTGFNAPLVKEARELHNFAAASNVAAMLRKIDFEAVHAWELSLVPAAEDGSEEPVEATPYLALSSGEQQVYRNDVMAGLSTGRWRELVADWVPYDGDVVEETSDTAIVHVRCSHRDPDLGLDDRWVEWKFRKQPGGRWVARSWERWISPEEEKVERQRRAKRSVKKTLSDGSEVIEGEVSTEFVKWHEETPQELRDEVVAQIALMVDLEGSAKQLSGARARLAEIGKHAVPGLLLYIAEVSPDMGPAGSAIDANFQLTYDQAVQIQLCHKTLETITGWLTSYNVHAAMGTTTERQGSGIRQWFGWYDKKFKRYWRDADTLVEDDPFFDDPDFKPRNAKEARDFDKYKREREARQGGN